MVAFTVIGENFGSFTAIGYFFSVTVNKKLKINFFCFEELNINKAVFFVASTQSKGLRIISG